MRRAFSSRAAWAAGSHAAAASATARSMVVGPQEPALAASARSTWAAASRDSDAVARAIRCARQGAISRDSTRAWIRGSRWTRFSASASSCIPAAVDSPSAAANGSAVNAATNGAPSPPIASSQPSAAAPESAQVAAPVSTVAGCSTHHCAASRSLRRSATRAAVSASSASASNQSASRSSTSTGNPCASVSIMSPFQHRPPTFGFGGGRGGLAPSFR